MEINESNSQPKRVKVFKLDKILMSITLVFFLIVIILLGYVFVRGLFISQNEANNLQLKPKLEALNVDQDQIIEDLNQEKVQNLLEKIKKDNQDLEKEDLEKVVEEDI